MGSELAEAKIALENIAAIFKNTPDPYEQLLLQRQSLEQMITLDVAPPSTRLPPELLLDIFHFFLPVSLPPKADEPHFMLPQVCRAWKDLVSQSPALWASIAVTFGKDTDVRDITSTAARWLSRAGNTYPLSIKVDCSTAYANTVHDNPDFASAFMDFVVSQAHRLRDVDLSLPFEALLRLFHLPSGSFPYLETISLGPLWAPNDLTPTDVARWHWPTDSLALHSAPLVREITYTPSLDHFLAMDGLEALIFDAGEQAMNDPSSVGATHHLTFAPRISLPWAQLKVINFPFTGFTPDVWCSILDECPAVMQLSIAIKPDPDQYGRITHRLKHLNALSISAFCGGIENMLDRLTTPNLKVLTCMGSPVVLKKILSFQSRSEFELVFLGIWFPTKADEIESFLEQFPALKGLVLMFTPIDRIPASFWHRIRNGELIPNLECIALQPTDALIPVLVDIIEAKWGTPDLYVQFLGIKPAHLQAVKDELKRLEKYGAQEVERKVVLGIKF
ncbi:hypothetical protein DFH06DRAFT_1182596 [Mycena polygramma]|nr:hypothetical protein DFH06DRAFT_1182596 [Mycena polygramma]